MPLILRLYMHCCLGYWSLSDNAQGVMLWAPETISSSCLLARWCNVESAFITIVAKH